MNFPFEASLAGISIDEAYYPMVHMIYMNRLWENVDEVHRQMELEVLHSYNNYAGFILSSDNFGCLVFSKNEVMGYLNAHNETYRKSLEEKELKKV